MRQEFPASVKRAAFARANGHCEGCGAILVGRPTYDHAKPDFFGGEPTLENCKAICAKCDKAKTYGEDIPRIAKTKRQGDKHAGVKKSRQPMAGSRGSKWKRRMDGTTILR